MIDILVDALVDAVKTFPFLFLIYVIMEIVEHSRGEEKLKKLLSGKYAPALGSVLGILPECGLSVMCGRLYAGGIIAFGTALAVFLSTSDEGLITLISSISTGKVKVIDIILVVLIRTVYACIVGVIFNIFIKKPNTDEEIKNDECSVCHGESHGIFEEYVLHPLMHALKILAWVFAVNICFNALFHYVGEDKISSFMNKSIYLQPVVSALVGLIPNCGSSVVIAGTYVNNSLCFGGLVAGLSANAGVGLTVIFKDKSRIKESLFLILSLYLLSVLLGYICLFI